MQLLFKIAFFLGVFTGLHTNASMGRLLARARGCLVALTGTFMTKHICLAKPEINDPAQEKEFYNFPDYNELNQCLKREIHDLQEDIPTFASQRFASSRRNIHGFNMTVELLSHDINQKFGFDPATQLAVKMNLMRALKQCSRADGEGQEGTKPTKHRWEGIEQPQGESYKTVILHGESVDSFPAPIKWNIFTPWRKDPSAFIEWCRGGITMNRWRDMFRFLHDHFANMRFPRKPIIHSDAFEVPFQYSLKKCRLVGLVDEQGKRVGISHDCDGDDNDSRSRMEIHPLKDVTEYPSGKSIFEHLPTRKKVAQDW